GIRDFHVTGVQTCALPISRHLDGFLRWPEHVCRISRYGAVSAPLGSRARNAYGQAPNPWGAAPQHPGLGAPRVYSRQRQPPLTTKCPLTLPPWDPTKWSPYPWPQARFLAAFPTSVLMRFGRERSRRQ